MRSRGLVYSFSAVVDVYAFADAYTIFPVRCRHHINGLLASMDRRFGISSTSVFSLLYPHCAENPRYPTVVADSYRRHSARTPPPGRRKGYVVSAKLTPVDSFLLCRCGFRRSNPSFVSQLPVCRRLYCPNKNLTNVFCPDF